MFFFCLIFCGLIFGTDYSNNDSVEGDDATETQEREESYGIKWN